MLYKPEQKGRLNGQPQRVTAEYLLKHIAACDGVNLGYIKSMGRFSHRFVPKLPHAVQQSAPIASAVLTCCIVLNSVVAQMPATTRADAADARFLEQLLDRGLFELAEKYCIDRQTSRSTVTSRAFWTDLLVTSCRQHTWLESRANRLALTSQAVDAVTDFVRDEQPEPFEELVLRLSQVHVLVNLSQIDVQLHQCGYRGPDAPSNRSLPSELPPRLQRCSELIRALQRQLNTIGRQLDRKQANRLRRLTRRLSVENNALQAIAQPDQFDTNPVLKQLTSLERAAQQADTRRTALKLLADCYLISNDQNRVQLTLQRLRQQFPDDTFTYRNLQIRILLRAGQAMQALKLCRTRQPASTDFRGDELALLNLEAILLMRTMASRLQDSHLTDWTDSRFDQAIQEATEWQPSVWRDGASAIDARYQLIRTVGVDAADSIELVEQLRTAGREDEARQQLQRALSLLRTDTPSYSRGAIHTAIGELHMAAHAWAAAIDSLEQAAEQYGAAERTDARARSELLAAFCAGQQWRAEPSRVDLYDKYMDRLIAHRTEWAGNESAEHSTQWLIQASRQADPLFAAQLALQSIAESTDRHYQQKQLVRMGTMLDELQGMSLRRESRCRLSHEQLVEEFTQQAETMLGAQGEEPPALANLQLLKHSLNANSDTVWVDWQSMSRRLPELRPQVDSADAATQQRWRELQLVSLYRTTTDADTQQQLSAAFVQEHRHAPLPAARRLQRLLTAEGLIQPGDVGIATTMEGLIKSMMQKTPTVNDSLSMLAMATVTQRFTGEPSLQNELLNDLLTRQLNEQNVREIATIVMKSLVSQNADTPETLLKLWQRARDAATKGSDLWLESIFQQARLRGEMGQQQQALQQLDVTAVVYPEWGSRDRQARVEQLRTILASSAAAATDDGTNQQ